jgi:hypothetical protein
MKIISLALLAVLLTCFHSAKDISYTGSTPAGAVIKNFLGIPLSDSIDFIRWRLTINDVRYTLQCNYGIGKPNTNGFIGGGKKIELTGPVNRDGSIFSVKNGNRILKIAELNKDLLHFLDDNNNPLKGNGGWSYTINSLTPAHTEEISISFHQITLEDSMVFEGRTPCGVPDIIEPGKLCYKLKWLVALYADPVKNLPTTFRIAGTAWRNKSYKPGSWEIIEGKNDRIIYRLFDSKGNILLNLLKSHDNILLFTDKSGKLLVGDEDFSYTLNRRS